MIRLAAIGFLLLLAPHASMAATLTGRVVNATTGEVGQADEIAVLDITKASGEPVAVATDVSGEFTLEGIPDAAAAHFRLRITSSGIEINQPIMSFDEPTVVSVYETTTDLTGVKILRHHIFFARDPEHIQVTEYMEFANESDPPRLITADMAAMKVFLDHDVHGAPVASLLDSQVPTDLQLKPSDEPGVSGMVHHLQPGPTRVFVRYMMHEDNRSMRWASRSLFDTDERRIFVNPTDIGVTTAGALSIDSTVEDYAAYALPEAEAGDEWVVELAGGSAVAATQDHDHGNGNEANRASVYSEVVSRPNRLTNSRTTILIGLGALLLFASLGALAASKRPNLVAGSGADESRLAVSKIADRYVSGKISKEEYEREAARVLKKSGSTTAPTG